MFAQCRQQADDLVALTAVRECQDHVVRVQHAEIAVQRSGGIQEISARARGIQGADDLPADILRLAHSGNCNSTAAIEQKIHNMEKRAVEPLGHLAQRVGLGAEHLPCQRKRLQLRPGSGQSAGHGRVPAKEKDSAANYTREVRNCKPGSGKRGIQDRGIQT